MTDKILRETHVFMKQIFVCPVIKSCKTGIMLADEQPDIVEDQFQKGTLRAGVISSGVEKCPVVGGRGTCCNLHVVLTCPSLNRVDLGDQP